MNRAVGVAKMQLINKWTFLGLPAVILVSSFALTVAIWAMLPASVTGPKYSGAGQAVIWYFFALGLQSMSLTFPFSQGLSISRRNFFLGTVGLFAVVAAVVAGLYVLLGYVESATHGWGLNGQMFALQWIAERNWFIQMFFYFVLMMLLFLAGFWGATVYKRWQATGALVMGLGLASLTPGTTGLLALGLAALLGVGAYLTLRRATP